jgi:hypothetical protein
MRRRSMTRSAALSRSIRAVTSPTALSGWMRTVQFEVLVPRTSPGIEEQDRPREGLLMRYPSFASLAAV